MLYRHGEAEKNTKLIHGGAGSPLIKKAYNILYKSISILKNLQIDIIYHSSESQCLETAIFFGKKLNISIKELKNVSPFHLGVLNGLSDIELEKKYPPLNQQMKKWRNASIEINELDIPGMSDPYEFYVKGEKVLDGLLLQKKNILIIGTRSILILFASLLLGRSPEKGGNYREIPWGNAEYITFIIDNHKYFLERSLSTIKI